MNNLNLLVSLISDEINGLIEIHFNNRELAEQALQNFIDEGIAIDKENGVENPEADVIAFFHIEHHEINSLDELDALHEEKSGGLFDFDIRAEAYEKLGLEG